MTFVLSLDAMGGDSAPRIVIEGAVKALADGANFSYLVFGDKRQIHPLLSAYSRYQQAFTLVHTDEAITNDMKTVVAIRTLKTSSMRLAIEAVVKGEAAAVISAGNTGAYMALSKLLLKTFKGIDRPAIATTLPTLTGRAIVMDLGANVECTSENLVQFAIMGHVFGQRLLGKKKPSVGLLNIGSEDMKGNVIIQEAAQILRAMPHLNFYGFVEGDDITAGVTDIVVTDGFTGNVALKTMEGTARLIRSMLEGSLRQSWRGKLGYLMAKPAFQQLKNRIDPRLYNGALFLGLQGIAVKSHGGTDAIGFANAIRVAVSLATDAASGQIAADLDHFLKEGD
ncbi:MAG: phosphate acyltransferase PlsX [Alphaproteobacteria bacterium]|jgi:glycerol-3-phosphate acyltransferase PlsX|nr:phosphate acyltransferase PlsX [Alphaproteobacteria bacterium]